MTAFNIEHHFKLTRIDFSFNDMNNIHIHDLPELVELRLANMKLSEVNIEYLPNLTTLDLENNELTTFPELYLPALTLFDLKSNKISNIPQGATKGLANLEILEMFSNKLMILDENTFEAMNNLKKLDLTFNNLMMLPNEVFKPLKSLEDLKLGGNRMVQLPTSLSSMKKLRTMNFFGNQLSNITILTKMNNVSEIDLRKNRNIMCECEIIDWVLNGNTKVMGHCANKHLLMMYVFCQPKIGRWDDCYEIHSDGSRTISNETYKGCACQRNPCQHGGICNVHDIRLYNCSCSKNYTGEHCQTRKGE